MEHYQRDLLGYKVWCLREERKAPAAFLLARHHSWECLAASRPNHNLAIKLCMLCLGVLCHVQVVSSAEAISLAISLGNAIH